MTCPSCGCRNTEVLETRRAMRGTDVERRHRCQCGARWGSVQTLVRSTLTTTGRGTGSPPVEHRQATEPPPNTTGSPPVGYGGVGGGLPSDPVRSLSLIPSPSGSLEARSQLREDLMSVLARYRYWHPKAIPQPSAATKELGLIKARLAEGYSAEDLCKAIDGYHHSPHHLGQNDRQTKYLSLALFMRDASHVQAGLEFMDKPAVQVTSKNGANVQAALSVLRGKAT